VIRLGPTRSSATATAGRSKGAQRYRPISPRARNVALRPSHHRSVVCPLPSKPARPFTARRDDAAVLRGAATSPRSCYRVAQGFLANPATPHTTIDHHQASAPYIHHAALPASLARCYHIQRACSLSDWPTTLPLRLGAEWLLVDDQSEWCSGPEGQKRVPRPSHLNSVDSPRSCPLWPPVTEY